MKKAQAQSFPGDGVHASGGVANQCHIVAIYFSQLGAWWSLRLAPDVKGARIAISEPAPENRPMPASDLELAGARPRQHRLLNPIPASHRLASRPPNVSRRPRTRGQRQNVRGRRTERVGGLRCQARPNDAHAIAHHLRRQSSGPVFQLRLPELRLGLRCLSRAFPKKTVHPVQWHGPAFFDAKLCAASPHRMMLEMRH